MSSQRPRPELPEVPALEWKSSNKLTDQQIQFIFAEMDEKGDGWISSKDIEKRFIRFGLFEMFETMTFPYQS
jgi:Ca2+-binding EF-hand superfamily protein